MNRVEKEVRYYMSQGNFTRATSELNSYTPSDSCAAKWTTIKGELQVEITKASEDEEKRK